MRNVLFAIVVIGALIGAAVGGTFANFSDYEVSEGNYFEMGEMDLVISDSLGRMYNGDTVPAFWRITNGWPECSKDLSFDIHNAGENEQKPPVFYLHLKNLTCEFTEPKVTYDWIRPKYVDGVLVAYLDGDGTLDIDIPVNEPTYVAILGGVAGEDESGAAVTVPGIGVLADCLLSRNIIVTIEYSIQYDTNQDPPESWEKVPVADRTTMDPVPLAELICEQVEIAELKGCWMRWFHVSMVAHDIDEDDLKLDYFADGSKFEHWPTNALQNQIVEWDIGFELLQD
jgi:predicted ribosomally synthesized peptide with SipW-like signal peptide